MIKWHCFSHSKSSKIKFKDYIPSIARELVSVGSVVSVCSGEASSKDVHIACGRYFKTPREAFEAAEKAFASNYPELYLRAVLNEGGKSRG